MKMGAYFLIGVAIGLTVVNVAVMIVNVRMHRASRRIFEIMRALRERGTS